MWRKYNIFFIRTLILIVFFIALFIIYDVWNLCVSPIIIGYDISPERLENTNRYIYSITDSDTLVFHSNSDITTHDIDLDNADSAFITYDTALSIVENYDNQKVLKK